MHSKHNRNTSQNNGNKTKKKCNFEREHNRSFSAVNELECKSSPRQQVIVIPAPVKEKDCFISQSTTLPNAHPLHKASLPKHAKMFTNDLLGKLSPTLTKLKITSLTKSKQQSGSKDISKKFNKNQNIIFYNQGQRTKNKDKIFRENKKISPNGKKYSGSKNKNRLSKDKNYNELEKDKEKNEIQNVPNKTKREKENKFVSWKIILEQFISVLTDEEKEELKEHKEIYFVGKISKRKTKPIINKLEITKEENADQIEDEFYKYEIGDHIAYRYEILESINKGSFGEVIKVFDHKWNEELALKIVKKCQEIVAQTFVEISILTQIKEKDRNNVSGVVRIKDFTIFRDHICILFELLSGNLYELLHANNYQGLDEEVVRIFAVQILNTLNFLRKEGVIHCDIKPENVVLRTWGRSGLKLVDFGTSCLEGKQIYEYLQSRYYRAPEIIARLPYSYPIDMWSFGCLIAELRIGLPLFAGSSNTEQILYMINSLEELNPTNGSYSHALFYCEEFEIIRKKSYLQEYRRLQKTPEILSTHPFFSTCKHLSHSMKSLETHFQETDPMFLDFIRKILVWEPTKRLLPSEALLMPWIRKGLPEKLRELYLDSPELAQTEPPLKSKQYQHELNTKKRKEEKSKDKNVFVKVLNKIEGVKKMETKRKKYFEQKSMKSNVNYNGLWSSEI